MDALLRPAPCRAKPSRNSRQPLHLAAFPMNILLLGSGGREHALAWKIAASPLLTKLWCAPGNAGIAREAECVALDIANHPAVIDFCKRNAVDLVVVGPETPLAAGIVDDLAAAGIKAFGPGKQAAQLEGSKGFTKDLCSEFNIPTGAYRRFHQCSRRAGLCAHAGRADRGQGRWACRRQGRGGRENAGRGRSRHRHDVRRRVRHGRRRSRDRGIPRRPRDQLLRAVRRRDRDPARLRAGPQARVRSRRGTEHRRHGRLFADAVRDAGDSRPDHGADHPADRRRHEDSAACRFAACSMPA